MKLLNKLADALGGAPTRFSLEHRIFNIGNFVISIFGIIATLLNYVIGLHWMTVLLGIAGTFVPFTLFYFSRFHGWFTKTTIYVYVVSTILVLGPMHFYNGGSSGTVVYLILMLLMIFLLISERSQQVWIYLSLGGAVLVAQVLEYLHPEWVIPYKDFDQQMSDHITVLLYIFIFTTMIIRIFRGSYDKDRQMILQQKQALESVMAVTLEKNQQIESLIRELHHRVKNNMQVVSSLLALQYNRIEDQKAKEALQEGRTRVDAMALIHQKLYLDNNLAAVNMNDYMETLLSSLATTYGFEKQNLVTKIELLDPTLNMDTAIPLGLIVNELVTNAFKHAFVNATETPQVTILILGKAEGSILLEVADNGKGLAASSVNANSFGMKLVQTLVNQLNGTVEHLQNNGTVYTINLNP